MITQMPTKPLLFIAHKFVEELCKDAHNTVLCDPGRRDLLCCIYEDST